MLNKNLMISADFQLPGIILVQYSVHFESTESNNNYGKCMQLEHSQVELINYLEHSQHDAPEVLVQLILIEVVTLQRAP
ncbi:unnamed protein product [Brugia timori]|uniref:Uncharacterized protein n=1 Tax=Brugia timori TaxID=42155 RepID=A0A3P7U2X3_9BILA|nr:unnamed protein product [Brugia timori]